MQVEVEDLDAIIFVKLLEGGFQMLQNSSVPLLWDHVDHWGDFPFWCAHPRRFRCSHATAHNATQRLQRCVLSVCEKAGEAVQSFTLACVAQARIAFVRASTAHLSLSAPLRHSVEALSGQRPRISAVQVLRVAQQQRALIPQRGEGPSPAAAMALLLLPAVLLPQAHAAVRV